MNDHSPKRKKEKICFHNEEIPGQAGNDEQDDDAVFRMPQS